MSASRYSLAVHAGPGESWCGEEQSLKGTEGFLRELTWRAGTRLLAGDTALDVVTEVVAQLEDYPRFNAGKGSAMNVDGVHELEAAVIDGRNCEYRAAAGLTKTKNPVRLAHAMLGEESPAFLVGAAADDLARHKKLEIVDNSYFTTPSRMKYWKSGIDKFKDAHEYHGAVGAVALDIHGNLAAASSTGGLNFRSVGRIGDTAIVGAGIYADDEVAIVCSGSSEAILKATVAGRVAADIRNGKPIDNALKDALLKTADIFPTSSFGILAVDWKGGISIECNSRIFVVASVSSNDPRVVAEILPSTTPIMNKLVCYRDIQMKIALSKYPTMADQINIEFIGASLLKFFLVQFLECFENIRTITKDLKEVFGVEFIGFVSRNPFRHAALFPFSTPRNKNSLRGQTTLPTTHTESLITEKGTYRDGFGANFYYKKDVEKTFFKAEVTAPDSTTKNFFSLDAETFRSATLALWKTLEVVLGNLNLKSLTIEIDPSSQTAILATISTLPSAPILFPGPATFHTEYPGYMSAELGPLASNILDLPAVAMQMAGRISSRFDQDRGT